MAIANRKRFQLQPQLQSLASESLSLRPVICVPDNQQPRFLIDLSKEFTRLLSLDIVLCAVQSFLKFLKCFTKPPSTHEQVLKNLTIYKVVCYEMRESQKSLLDGKGRGLLQRKLSVLPRSNLFIGFVKMKCSCCLRSSQVKAEPKGGGGGWLPI